MTLAQRFRWFVYRLRARFSRAPDNAPVVTVENGAADKPTLAARVRARLHRYFRMAGGFVVTLLLLGAVGLYLLAVVSRVSFALSPVLETPEHSPRAMAAAEFLFRLPQAGVLDEQHLFATPGLRRREAAAFEAAAEPARAYVALLRIRRGARDPLIEEARESVQTEQSAPADALDRLAAAASRQQVVIDTSPQAFRTLAAEASASLAARAADLAERARSSGVALEDDDAFHAARGEAYGWMVLLHAAAADTDDAAVRDSPALARAMTALAHAADYRPVLFVTGPRGGVFAPNHLSVVGLDIAIAAQEARELATPR